MLGSRCVVSRLDLVSPGPVRLWVGLFGFPWWVGEVLVERVVECEIGITRLDSDLRAHSDMTQSTTESAVGRTVLLQK